MANSTSSIPSSLSSTLSSSTLSSISSSLSSSTTSSSSSTSSLSTSTTSIPVPSTTFTQTLTITQTPSLSQPPVTITRTTTNTSSSFVVVPSSTTSAPSSTTSASLQSNGTSGSGGGGLSTAGKTAIAVVVPVVVVALLVLAGILLWRRRKQKKDAEEARRKEIQDYGYNPNNDPTLPTVMQESNSEMAEDTSGYRGWGAATASNRKTSTTLSGGLAQMSDAGSNVYGPGPHSPGNPTSDANSGDGLMNRRETMGSDDLGALGVAPVAANQPIRRGPSNASSAYSNGARSDNSDDQPPLPVNGNYNYDYPPGQYGYTQHGPYGDGSYGGGQDNGMPIVRDVSARRNTRIQQGGTYQQGNSGIAQNF